jgi:hypothetical protein
MFKSSWLLGLIFALCGCKAQSTYILYSDIKPIARFRDDDIHINAGSCDDCDSLERSYVDPNIIAHNLRVKVRWDTWDTAKARGWNYNQAKHRYIAKYAFINLMRSAYYYNYVKANKSMLTDTFTPRSELSLGISQNVTSQESKLDSMETGTIRYRVICKDCPYPKREKLYYIFYYDKNNLIIRHGLAELKKARR